MDKNKKIALAKEINNRITSHIADIWPGFTPIPFIIYDDKNQVAVGTKWPERYVHVQEDIWVADGADPQLFACTVTIYHGVITAIWDARTWPDNLNIAEAAGNIAHEMFHAFQHSFTSPGPNDLLLPQYPHSVPSVALVIEENRLLSEIVEKPDFDSIHRCMEKIFALRKQREIEIGADFISYDNGCESYEGTSAYVEICMKAIIEGKSPFEAASSYLEYLNQNNNFLNHYRARCYASGLILCLAADVICGKWQAEWMESGKTLFDWMKDKLTHTDAETPDMKAAAELLATHQHEKEQKISEFMANPMTSFEGAVQLVMFDPMNLVCAGGRCLHKHGKLRFGENEQLMATPFLIEYGDDICDVKRVLIPNIVVNCDGSRMYVEGFGEMNGYVEESSSGIRCVIT